MSQQIKATDFLIQCKNPVVFDRTINQLGAAVLVQSDGEYLQKDGYYIMRIFANAGYIKFAITNQGYGEIIKELEELV